MFPLTPDFTNNKQILYSLNSNKTIRDHESFLQDFHRVNNIQLTEESCALSKGFCAISEFRCCGLGVDQAGLC